ncbi:MAG: hypothetical protein ACOYIB_02065 [Desulfosporosinus sp.]|jgi:hypothetical protein
MMTVQKRLAYQPWAMRLALVTTFIVVLLSWLNAVKITGIFFRAGVSFGVMYLLTAGSLNLFEWAAVENPEDEQHEADSERGGLVDVSVGDEDAFPTPSGQDTKIAGQLDPDLSEGMPDYKRQAEIVRRMGWGDS